MLAQRPPHVAQQHRGRHEHEGQDAQRAPMIATLAPQRAEQHERYDDNGHQVRRAPSADREQEADHQPRTGQHDGHRIERGSCAGTVRCVRDSFGQQRLCQFLAVLPVQIDLGAGVARRVGRLVFRRVAHGEYLAVVLVTNGVGRHVRPHRLDRQHRDQPHHQDVARMQEQRLRPLDAPVR